MILMAMLILMICIHMKVATLITMFIWFRITSQVPYQSTKFCQSCGIVKEPFTLDKDIAFQVNNVNSNGRDSVGIWTCRSGIMMLIFAIKNTIGDGGSTAL